MNAELLGSAIPAHEPERLRPLPAGQDGAAFERLFRRYHGRIVAFLSGYVADKHLVDDLAQETLFRAYRQGLHRETSGSPWPWLAKVARNLATDTARRPQTWPEVADDAGHRGAPADEPEALLVAAALRAGVIEILGSVSARQARILMARYVEGAGYEAIAAREEMSVEAVRSSLFRARRTFRRRYERMVVGRGLGAFLPGLVAGWRLRLRSLRGRVRDLASLPAPLEAFTGPAMPALAAGAALGAFTVVTVLVPGTGPAEGGVPDVRLPAAVEMVSIAEAVLAQPVTTAARADVPETSSDTPPPGGADPGATLAPSTPPLHVDEISTDDVVPVEEPPARASNEADADPSDGRFSVVQDHESDLDPDGDGEGEIDNHASVVMDCTGDWKGVVSGPVCMVIDALPDQSG